jgi:hypothetical protein
MQITLGEALGWIRDLGSLAIMALIIWGAINEQPAWVPGSTHRKALEEKDAQHARELRSREERDKVAWRERDEQMQRILAERDVFRDELFSMAGLANRATVVASRANRVADRVTRAAAEDDSGAEANASESDRNRDERRRHDR